MRIHQVHELQSHARAHQNSKICKWKLVSKAQGGPQKHVQMIPLMQGNEKGIAMTYDTSPSHAFHHQNFTLGSITISILNPHESHSPHTLEPHSSFLINRHLFYPHF